MSVGVLGLDGGGTKTLVAVADRSGAAVVLAGPGLDPTAGDGWEARLAGLVAGVGPVQAAVLGLPYFTEVPAISARQVVVAQQVLGPQAQVRNDVDIAFEGALGGADGVLVLAGTGSMAWARGPRGVVRCGGYGEVFGDEGSAYWIGREALALVSRHLDGRRRAPGLAAGILGALGVAGDQVIAWTYGQAQPRAAIAGLAVVVAGLAEGGNRDAVALMARAARQLGDLGRAARRAAGLGLGCGWSYAGGVMGNAALRARVAGQMGSDPLAPVLPPVGGAVLAAARAAGWDVTPKFIKSLALSLGQAAQSGDQSHADTD